MRKTYFVYILANRKYGNLYIGITNNLTKRVWEHKNILVDGFSIKYEVDNLVYFEETNDISSAIAQEKRLKKMEKRLENSTN